MPLVTDDWEIRDILAHVQRIAVVGLSSNPQRPSHAVARAMQSQGYAIAPVNPNETRVLGEHAVASLTELAAPVGMVDVFRDPRHVPAIVDTCIERGVRYLWLQEGVVNHAAANHAADAGIHVVMDRCMLKEYRRLLG